MEYAIETDGLTKRYGDVVAIRAVSLRVPRGAFYGFLGPNGAGKSTTLRILTGLTRATEGQVRLLGMRLEGREMMLKRRMGVVPEESCLMEYLTGPEFVCFAGRMYGLPKATAYRRAMELLEAFELPTQGKQIILEYSLGMRKKVSLAAALIHEPELLFLDEPFEGIDPLSVRTIRALLQERVQRGATIFFTSHVLEVVEKLCTHIGVIHAGSLVYEGELSSLLRRKSLEEWFIQMVQRSLAARREN